MNQEYVLLDDGVVTLAIRTPLDKEVWQGKYKNVVLALDRVRKGPKSGRDEKGRFMKKSPQGEEK